MDIKKKIAIVQCYIGIRKGVDVDISVNSIRDVMLLNQAYLIATTWMDKNNCKVTTA